jgi:FkbM family methyltransferase
MGLRTWLGLKRRRPAGMPPPPFWEANSRAQLLQDRWVLTELEGKHRGFFVEVGAFDGITLSNTYVLEKDFGWTGILAEPNPKFSDNIRQIRTAPLCTLPVDATTGREVEMLFVTNAPEYSSMSDLASHDSHAGIRTNGVKATLRTISLNDLLEQHSAPREIDFVSIDTEGNELDILSSFDFDRYRIRLLSIEHNDTPANQLLDQRLVPLGYERVHREWSRFDAWYVRR